MSGISTIRNNVGVVIINALGWVLLSREYRDALKGAIARGLSAQDVDLTLAALGLIVTDTPTEAHLRVLPRERYDAVLDSGPTDSDEGADCG